MADGLAIRRLKFLSRLLREESVKNRERIARCESERDHFKYEMFRERYNMPQPLVGLNMFRRYFGVVLNCSCASQIQSVFVNLLNIN